MSVSRFRRPARVTLRAFGVLLVAGTAGAQTPSAAPARARWDSLASGFMNAYFAALPDIAVNAGRHDLDGQLPDWSAAGLAAFDSLLTSWRTRAAAFDTTALHARAG